MGSIADMKEVTYEKDGAVAIIKLNRPEKLNAFGNQMKAELRVAWRAFVDDPSARVAILTGEGRAFCAGRDIKEHDAGVMGNATVYEGESDFPMPRHCPVIDKPIIAAINGLAAGGGIAMCLTADLRIASDRAVFMYSELQTGIIGPWDLANDENIPVGSASWIALSGEPLTAQRAYEVGLLGKVVPHEGLMDEAMKLANHVQSLPPKHLMYTINLMHRVRYQEREPELKKLHTERYTELLYSPDTKEAARAFVERRTPVFTGNV
jgi:2-(1,2-epoxy-1,2-dihydrophenyl)acetyl-CoA isomerase